MNDSDSDGPVELAFGVNDDPSENTDLNVPPTSGNEYLRRVRSQTLSKKPHEAWIGCKDDGTVYCGHCTCMAGLEAKGCPRVVVADIDTKAFLQQQTVKVSEPSGLLPVPSSFRAPMAWQRLQVAEFAQLRQKLIQWKALIKSKKIKMQAPNLPLAKDAESWCRLCFGRMKIKTSSAPQATPDHSDMLESSDDGTPPLLSIVAHMDQQQVENVLEYHINWLEATGFSANQGRWLFALLANLQKPLTPETCSWLRRLSRLCSNIRASLDNSEDPRLHELNLIICLVSRYFEQRDLADT